MGCQAVCRCCGRMKRGESSSLQVLWENETWGVKQSAGVVGERNTLTRILQLPISFLVSQLPNWNKRGFWECFFNNIWTTGRSRFRFPMVSLEFFIDIILPAAL